MAAGKVLSVLALVAVVAIPFGFYVSYRNTEAEKVTHLTSLSQIQGVTPTICTYSVGAYGSGSGGTLYIADDRMRIDVPDLENAGYSGSAEAVIGLDGTRFIDPKSEHALANGSNGVSFGLNMIITQAPWKCSPWWFSDSGLFTIPNAVTF